MALCCVKANVPLDGAHSDLVFFFSLFAHQQIQHMEGSSSCDRPAASGILYHRYADIPTDPQGEPYRSSPCMIPNKLSPHKTKATHPRL